MKANGLKLKEIESQAYALGDISEHSLEEITVKHFAEQSLVVAWTEPEVLIGKWKDGHFLFPEGKTVTSKLVLRMRVFNPDKELMIWRTHQGLKGRLRHDHFDGQSTDVIIADQVLVGTGQQKGNEGTTILREERGHRLVMPFDNLKTDAFGEPHNPKNRIFLRTHTYIDYTHAGQATYIDTRFVGFRQSVNGMKEQTEWI